MIKVKIADDYVLLKGHANFDNYGKDIVCAAVSSIITACANDIHTVNPNALDYTDDGNTLIVRVKEEDELCYKLLGNLKEMLITLSEDYPKNIKIVESEE